MLRRNGKHVQVTFCTMLSFLRVNVGPVWCIPYIILIANSEFREL